MIGLLELDDPGLVRAGIERTDQVFSTLGSIDAVLRELGSLDALIIEARRADDALSELLAVARSRSLPTLFVSRDRSVGTAVDMLRAGATDYLAAPFELESLARALDRLLDASDAAAAPENDVGFVTGDEDLLRTLEMVRTIAASDATVLIEGESGTGKELLAQLVHRGSPRRDRPMISINCAALPAGLLESELFGHERGAFTGAVSRAIGKFELAHGTTILLDEIGELELGLQAKLLRVLQEKQVQRVGGQRPVNVDFRLVATTNRDLADEARSGRFREDLFYRLNVLPVRLKPLRERAEDVRLLISRFLSQHAAAGRALPLLPPETLAALEAHAWPGNVRELENVLERLVLTRGGQEVRADELGFIALRGPAPIGPTVGPSIEPAVKTIREMERWLIVQTLLRLEGNRTRAARELGISLRTLRNKIREFCVDEPGTLPQRGTAHAARSVVQILPGER